MKDIKTIIKESKISIVRLLPNGAISRLAKKHGIARQNVPKMLEGEFGSPEKLEALVTDAWFLIEEDLKERGMDFRKLNRELKKVLKVA